MEKIMHVQNLDGDRDCKFNKIFLDLNMPVMDGFQVRKLDYNIYTIIDYRKVKRILTLGYYSI